MATLTPVAQAAMIDMPYTGAPLDRGDHLRGDAAALARLRHDPRAHRLLIWRNRVLVRTTPDDTTPHVLDAPLDWTPPSPAVAPEEEVFLGVDAAGIPWFALQVPAGTDEPDDPGAMKPGPDGGPSMGLGGVFVPLRTLGPSLPATMAAILAQSLGVLAWHRRHRFCAACGAPSHPDYGGWRRCCSDPACGTAHFPRTDPAVIMLVSQGTGDSARCLLAHACRMPPGLISTLAGFVEPGESLEEAVRREVWEETGVRVGAVAYAASQPWPFPASLMVGFYAQADTTALTLDPQEIESAGWYDRAQLRHMLTQEGPSEGGPPGTDGLFLSRSDSLAFRLIQGWLAGDPMQDIRAV